MFPAVADVGVPQKLLVLVAVFVSYQRLDVADGLEGTGLVTNQFHPVGSILKSGVSAYTVRTQCIYMFTTVFSINTELWFVLVVFNGVVGL